MRILLTTATAAVVYLAGAPVEGQAPDGSANRTAIERLDLMVGRWEGEAWMLRGTGQVQTTMTENIERKLGGVTLLIEGTGVIPGEGSSAPRVVHNALAVVSFDPQTGGYVMRSYIASGLWGDFALTPIEGGVSWSREVPGGRVRNTAKIANGE